MLLAFTASPLGLAQSPHDAIHPKDRFFTPDAIRKALAGEKTGSLPGLPAGVSPDLVSSLLKKAADNPEQFKSLMDMVQKTAGNLPLDKLNVDPQKADPRIREFAERIARNPEFRERFLENPEFRKLAERFQKKNGANGDNPGRSQTDSQGGESPSEADPGTRSRVDPDQNNESSRPSSTAGESGKGQPSRSIQPRGDPSVAVERANRAMRKLWSGKSNDSSSSRRGEGRANGGGGSNRWLPDFNRSDPQPRESDRRNWLDQWAERLQNENQNQRREAADRAENREESLNGGNRAAERRTNSIREPNRSSEGSNASNNSVPRESREGPSSRSGDWFSWASDRMSKVGQVGTKAGERFGSWMPKMPAMKVPEIRLPSVRLPSMRIPATSIPTMPAGGVSMRGMGWSAMILVMAIAIVAALWTMSAKVGFGSAKKDKPLYRRRRLGSQDEREQIRWIFEDLALAKLGEPACTMNHRAIAADYAFRSPAMKSTAKSLGDLYESARYWPPEANFTPDNVVDAKRLAAELRSASTVASPG